MKQNQTNNMLGGGGEGLSWKLTFTWASYWFAAESPSGYSPFIVCRNSIERDFGHEAWSKLMWEGHAALMKLPTNNRGLPMFPWPFGQTSRFTAAHMATSWWDFASSTCQLKMSVLSLWWR